MVHSAARRKKLDTRRGLQAIINYKPWVSGWGGGACVNRELAPFCLFTTVARMVGGGCNGDANHSLSSHWHPFVVIRPIIHLPFFIIVL